MLAESLLSIVTLLFDEDDKEESEEKQGEDL